MICFTIAVAFNFSNFVLYFFGVALTSDSFFYELYLTDIYKKKPAVKGSESNLIHILQ